MLLLLGLVGQQEAGGGERIGEGLQELVAALPLSTRPHSEDGQDGQQGVAVEEEQERGGSQD